MNPKWTPERDSCLEVASSLRRKEDTEIKRQEQDKSNQAEYYRVSEGGSVRETGHCRTSGGMS